MTAARSQRPGLFLNRCRRRQLLALEKEREGALRFAGGKQFVARLPGERLKILDRMGIGRHHAQNLAGRLLVALAALPQEDVALLKDGMTDQDYAAFLALLNNP